MLRGRGIAAGYWGNGSGPASAIASVNPDGSISLVEGAPDIGGSRTTAAMHVAEALGLASEDIRPSIGDTDSIGYSTGAGGSGVTQKIGTACYLAAEDVKKQMIERAAKIWEVPADEVENEGSSVRSKYYQELTKKFIELTQQCSKPQN